MVGDLQRPATQRAGREGRGFQPDLEGCDGAILRCACCSTDRPCELLPNTECGTIDLAPAFITKSANCRSRCSLTVQRLLTYRASQLGTRSVGTGTPHRRSLARQRS